MSYAHTHVGFSPTLILTVGLLGGVVALVASTVSAVLCDTYGRRRVIMAAFAVGVPWSFVMLPMVNTGSTLWFAVAIAGTFAVAGCAYGPMAAFIPEIFATRYRYSGAGLSLNLAGLAGGAAPTIVAAPLLASYGVTSVGVMLAAVVAVSLVCTARLPETKDAALQQDFPHGREGESRCASAGGWRDVSSAAEVEFQLKLSSTSLRERTGSSPGA